MGRLSPMRRAVGVVLLVIGATWVMLGLGVVSGSVASGNTWYAVAGAGFFVAGAAVLFLRQPPPPEPPEPPTEA